MSIQRSIQTGLMIGQVLQTAALRNQVAQMQQLVQARQDQTDAVAFLRQLVFTARKTLDEAERALNTDPTGAFYSISLACLNLNRISDTAFTDFHEKETLYENQRRGADLLSHVQSLLPPEAVQQLHRLAWLSEVQVALGRYATWVQIREKAQASAIFFTPAPGVGRSILLFIAGNIAGGIVAGPLFALAHPLGLLAYLGLNGITLNIGDHVVRSKMIGDYHRLAQTVGGWVGKGFSSKVARTLEEQVRAQLNSWDYSTAAKTSLEADKELKAVDEEIAELTAIYFPSRRDATTTHLKTD